MYDSVYVLRVMTFYSVESRGQGAAVATGAPLLRMPPPVHLHSWQVVFVLVCQSICLVLPTRFSYLCASMVYACNKVQPCKHGLRQTFVYVTPCATTIVYAHGIHCLHTWHSLSTRYHMSHVAIA